MSDSLEEIQFEYERLKNSIDVANGVGFMKDGIKMVAVGVEMGNAKIGPILHLDGWSDEVARDINKYDNALERLYKKHWRKGSMSPESELAFGLGSSMVIHHCKAKFFGGSGTSTVSSESTGVSKSSQQASRIPGIPAFVRQFIPAMAGGAANAAASAERSAQPAPYDFEQEAPEGSQADGTRRVMRPPGDKKNN